MYRMLNVRDQTDDSPSRSLHAIGHKYTQNTVEVNPALLQVSLAGMELGMDLFLWCVQDAKSAFEMT